MSWYAVDSVDAALNATRRFLFPFQIISWAKLAIIVLFLGSVGSTVNPPGISVSFSGPLEALPALLEETPVQEAVTTGTTQLTAAELTTIAAGIGIILVVWLLFRTIVAAFWFVFYDSIRANTVTIIRPFIGRFGQAIRVVGFKIGITAITSAPVVSVGVAGYLFGVSVRDPSATVSIGLLILGLYSTLGALFLWGVFRFTDEFIVPIMTLTDGGVVAAWTAFTPTLKKEWKQFVGYLLVHFLLALLIGIAQSVILFVGIGIVLALVLLAGIILVFGIAGSVAVAMESIAVLVGLGTVAVFAIVAIVLVALPLRILVVSYLTMYELSVLRFANREFDLLLTDAAKK